MELGRMMTLTPKDKVIDGVPATFRDAVTTQTISLLRL